MSYISQSTAEDMTATFRSNRESILKTEYQNEGILPICETFDKSYIESLVGLTACSYIRIYYGMSENLQVHAIIVAADENGDDILPSQMESNVIVENGNRCPDICPPTSPLNS